MIVSLVLCSTIADASGFKALIISGVNKDPEQIREKDRAAMRLRTLLVDELWLPEEDVILLASPDGLVRDPDGVASTEAIQTQIRQWGKAHAPGTRYLFYYVGQANLVDEKLRLNLPGPDVSHPELVSWLKLLPAEHTVVVLDCPGAGIVAKPLQHAASILVVGARSDQPHSTSFSNYFVPALCNPDADFDENGYTSLLESFQWAVQRVDERYRDNNFLKNETALIEDDGDGLPSQFPWNYMQSGKDGARAAHYFLEENAPTELASDTPATSEDGGRGENHEQEH